MRDVVNHLNSYTLCVSSRKARQRSKSNFQQSTHHWHNWVDEIFASGQVDLLHFAKELSVSKSTARRLRLHQVRQPRQNVLGRLLALHLLYCPERYAQKPLSRSWLIAQGWEAGRADKE